MRFAGSFSLLSNLYVEEFKGRASSLGRYTFNSIAMPRYYPNACFSDCWSSAGEVTFYHRDGVCFWKKRAHPEFPGTLAQMEHQAVHLRALGAWRGLESSVQEQWNSYAVGVQSHRPPFKADHHITGHNLFVSAYHGFAQLGDEKVPVPMEYEDFPIVYCEFDSVEVVESDNLSIKLRTKLDGNAEPGRYRVAVRIQLTRPGCGRQPGYLRSFVASENCTSRDGFVEVFVPDYRDIWDLDLVEYQVHMRYLLIDSKTGYRCNFKKKSFLMRL